jgi:hypothetical protein
VRTYCVDRSHKCESAVTDEDLAITLYVVMRNCFQRHPVVEQGLGPPYLMYMFLHAVLRHVLTRTMREHGGRPPASTSLATSIGPRYVQESLEHYATRHPGPVTAERRGRARQAIKYRMKTFESAREQLRARLQ